MEIRLNLMPMNRNYDEEVCLYERDNPLYITLISIPKKISFKNIKYAFYDSHLSLDLNILDLYYREI